MPYETNRVAVTDTPQDLAVLASLDPRTEYVVYNESPTSDVFVGDHLNQPAQGAPAFPLTPGDSHNVITIPPLKVWVWCKSGQSATLIIGGTQTS